MMRIQWPFHCGIMWTCISKKQKIFFFFLVIQCMLRNYHRLNNFIFPVRWLLAIYLKKDNRELNLCCYYYWQLRTYSFSTVYNVGFISTTRTLVLQVWSPCSFTYNHILCSSNLSTLIFFLFTFLSGVL